MVSVPHRRRGFTLFELLITLVVISTTAAVVIPAFFASPEITLENASVLLAHDLRAAQNRSAYLAEPSRFEFFSDGDGYRVVGPRGQVVENPTTGLPFVRRYSEDAVFRGVRILEANCGGDSILEYNAGGQALESARIVLAFRGETRTLELGRTNGRVRILGTTSGFVDRGY
ncbi:MAG TPA: type II secretion system protein [Planctomycetes bacterium]|nr:type II secretion system protein [Planctomycetota bacterium]